VKEWVKDRILFIRKNNRLQNIIILIIIILFAAIPRLLLLDKIPPGLHGDEGWSGIDANKILSLGYIEPYVTSALGQPTGPLYFSAIFIKLFDDSVYVLRLSMTFFGILSIPSFYILSNLFFKKKISLLITIALSFSLFHMHYSRIAFMLISSSFFQIWTLYFLIKGYKSNKIENYLLSGLFCGIGLHSYNVYTIFPLIILSFFTFQIIISKFSYSEILKIFSFIFTFIISALPLLLFIFFSPDTYFSHHEIYSFKSLSENYNALSIFEKSSLFFSNGINNISGFFIGYSPDYVDAFGQFYTINYIYLFLALCGIIIIIKRRDQLEIFFLLSFIITVIFPSFLTYDAIYRRKILSVIYIFFFIGVFLNNISLNKIYFKTLIITVFTISLFNLHLYFNVFPRNSLTKWIFAYELTQMANFINDIKENDSKVIFYSNRWDCNYETFRYITNNINCETRSAVFGNSYKIQAEIDSDIILLQGDYLPIYYLIEQYNPNRIKYVFHDPDTNELIGIIYK
jgi:4-amino-4-deoxy-L-arabinose transferase-like glycosyltransferase